MKVPAVSMPSTFKMEAAPISATSSSLLYSSLPKMCIRDRLLASNQERSNKKMAKISSEIEEIKEKPAKRWESVVTNVIVAIITALITYALTAAGLK